MSTAAIVPVGDLLDVNSLLEAAGFGPRNFSVPAYGAAGPTHAALHVWGGPMAGVLAQMPQVTVDASGGDIIARVRALIEGASAQWAVDAAEMPAGMVQPGLYTVGGQLWRCIQAIDRSVYTASLDTYPAHFRRLRTPGVAEPWRQPIDQYDAYQLVDPFTGEPEECTHDDRRWRTTLDVNVWEPGTTGSGWVEVLDGGGGAEPSGDDGDGEEAPELPGEWTSGVWYQLGDKVTFEGHIWESIFEGNNVWSPSGYPPGWKDLGAI